MTDPWTIADEWAAAGEHRWMLDKLLLADHFKHRCGPAGVPVPQAGVYIVRQVMDLTGMGMGSRSVRITKGTEFLPAGSFWCEIFTGRHLSVDFDESGAVVRVAEALHEPPGKDHLAVSKPALWRIVGRTLEGSPWSPMQAFGIEGPTNWEYIDGKVVGVSFQTNQSFRWGNTQAWPVYESKRSWREMPPADGLRFVEDEDHDRLGFWIDA